MTSESTKAGPASEMPSKNGSGPQERPEPIRKRPHGRLRSKSAYTRPLARWPHYRAKITRLYREAGGHATAQFNDRKRALLAQCVFDVVNDLEHKHAQRNEQPPVVDALFRVMNRLYDDLGINEYFAREIPK